MGSVAQLVANRSRAAAGTKNPVSFMPGGSKTCWRTMVGRCEPEARAKSTPKTSAPVR